MVDAKQCLDRFDLGWAGSTPGPGAEDGSGVLEQLVLEKDLVVWAEVEDVELKAAESEAVTFELKGRRSAYESYQYALMVEVELRVRGYLRGEGPNIITAVVEGQLAFNDLGEVGCARRILEKEVGPLFGSNEGIALLESTSDPHIYHMGLAYENFKGIDGHHSTWLPYSSGSFYNRSSYNRYTESLDGWMSLADVRQRVSSVLEENNRRDD